MPSQLTALRRESAVGTSTMHRRREINGSVDLISHFNLSRQYDYFCQAPLPSIDESHYLHDVVGKTEIDIEKGRFNYEIIQTQTEEKNVRIQPFDLDLLRSAFQFREAAPASDTGFPATSGKLESGSKDKERAREHILHRQNDEIEKKRKRDGDEGVGAIQRKTKFKIIRRGI